MEIDETALREQLLALTRRPNDLDVDVEARHVKELSGGPLAGPLGAYAEPRLEGVGGSGIVFSAIYLPHGARRAIKLPRQRLYADTLEVAVPEDPEIEALSKLSHQNITRLFDSFKLEGGHGACVVTEYVTAPRPLDQFAAELCCSNECRRDGLALSAAVRQLAEAIAQVVDALHYMHETANLLHFDIKPDNILVAESGRPFVTDLGFARDLRRYERAAPEERVDIGFTWKYAHPSLTNPDAGARVTRTPAKSKNTLLAADLSRIFDVFAFGRTLQEVLRVLEREYLDSIHSEYTFNFLHLVACLCLDGRNAANGYSNPNRTNVTDTALGMPPAVFRAHKFGSFAEVKTALERLLGRRRPEDEVPELDPWASSTINVSDLGVTTLTPRVRALLEHPAVERLADESQLGLVSTIFPTATHSRLQHSLGVFHAVREYITALYYDPENPTFRVFFSAASARRALLAAVVHDLGQTTFGHELEEVDAATFDHATMAKDVAESRAFLDAHRRTLKDLIEGEGAEGWGVRFEEVLALLRGGPTTPFESVLHDVLDSPLDADKLDYLVRDSVETRVQYGRGIDHQRFLRSLTTATSHDGQRLRLAVKQKGAASAESFALARYQLYQSVYWHHTFRVSKAMLLTVAGDVVRSSADVASAGPQPPLRGPARARLRTAYLKFVLGLGAAPQQGRADGQPSRRRRAAEPAHEDDLGARLAGPEEPPSTKTLAANRTIRFLWKLSADRSRKLVEDLIARRYYKRIYEMPLSALQTEGWTKLRELFNSDRRLDFRDKLEAAFRDALNTNIQNLMKDRESLKVDHSLERVIAVARERYLFLVDLPTRGWVSGGGRADLRERLQAPAFPGGPLGLGRPRHAVVQSDDPDDASHRHVPGLLRARGAPHPDPRARPSRGREHDPPRPPRLRRALGVLTVADPARRWRGGSTRPAPADPMRAPVVARAAERPPTRARRPSSAARSLGRLSCASSGSGPTSSGRPAGAVCASGRQRRSRGSRAVASPPRRAARRHGCRPQSAMPTARADLVASPPGPTQDRASTNVVRVPQPKQPWRRLPKPASARAFTPPPRAPRRGTLSVRGASHRHRDGVGEAPQVEQRAAQPEDLVGVPGGQAAEFGGAKPRT